MHKTSDYAFTSLIGVDAQAIEIPYKGRRVSMIIILPNKVDGLAKLESQYSTLDLEFSNEKISDWEEVKIEIAIPKFKIESEHDLNPALKELGMKHMFSGQEADFSGITEEKDLYVSNVLQKAFIEVNEEGAEAAAATAAILKTRTIAVPKKFISDRPFLFIIKDKLTGVVLFSGKITNPSI